MKKLALLCAVALVLAVPCTSHAEDAKAPKKGAAPAMDMDAMMKMAAPGPQHDRIKKMEGQWDVTAKFTMDPSQPNQESKSTSSCKMLMDGRYLQEEASGDMMGMPFMGMGITGYDNVTKKYVSIWLDNMGTGIMTSEGTADASGSVITWTGSMSDPMTGKMTKVRMVTRITDADHHVFEMYMKGPNGKEFKSMELTYTRKAA